MLCSTMIDSPLKIQRYTPLQQKAWDEFAESSKNGSFILKRDYMEYHSDRFQDHSIMIFKETKNKLDLIALFPANEKDNMIYSHQGLTYGGLIINKTMTMPDYLALFYILCEYYQKLNFIQMVYKTVPSFYHKNPAEEDKYTVFLWQATLIRRDIYSVIDNHSPAIDWQTRRKRTVKKAALANLQITRSKDFAAYWQLLQKLLHDKYDTEPTHNLNEIEDLSNKFPDNIKLFIASKDEILLAGIVLYETENAAHCQYIGANEAGKDAGALDFLFNHLIVLYREKRFFSFGISNEQNGKKINTNLIKFKEGFGARTICHDFYQINLQQDHTAIPQGALL